MQEQYGVTRQRAHQIYRAIAEALGTHAAAVNAGDTRSPVFSDEPEKDIAALTAWLNGGISAEEVDAARPAPDDCG